MKSNQVIQSTIADGVISISVKGVTGTIRFDPKTASAACRARAELHGWLQRLSDRAALSRDPKTGAAASPQTKFDLIKQLADHYASGTAEWNLKAAPKRDDTIDLVIPAIMRVYGDPEEKAEATVQRLMAKRAITREEALKVWAGTDKVAAAIVDIRAERARVAAQGAPDSDDLMAELMEEEAEEEEEEEEAEEESRE